MPEESVVGAGVIKCINCLEKETEGELVQSAAANLVFVTGFNPESPYCLEPTGGRGGAYTVYIFSFFDFPLSKLVLFNLFFY